MRKPYSTVKVFSFVELLVCSHSSISLVMPLTLLLTRVPSLFPIKVRLSQNILLSELKRKFSFNLDYISCELLIFLCPLWVFFPPNDYIVVKKRSGLLACELHTVTVSPAFSCSITLVSWSFTPRQTVMIMHSILLNQHHQF